MIIINGKNYSEEDFKKLVRESKAKTDLTRKLGFSYTCGTSWKSVNTFIEKYNLSIDHFDTLAFKRFLRGFDKEISKALLEEQVALNKTLKEIAKVFQCSQNNIRYWIKKFDLKLKRGAKGKKPKDFITPRKCVCGETDPSKFYGNKTTVCGKCHNKIVHVKGKENRAYMLTKLGNQCLNCGFDKWKASLDIHHINPSKKDVSFPTARYWAREKIDKELVKCVLLCRNCHAAHHSGELVNEKLTELPV